MHFDFTRNVHAQNVSMQDSSNIQYANTSIASTRLGVQVVIDILTKCVPPKFEDKEMGRGMKGA